MKRIIINKINVVYKLILCVSQFTKKLHKIMINKKMIEKFKTMRKCYQRI